MLPDLTHRAHLEEAMDAIEAYSEYRRCLHDLDSVSRLVLAHRPTLCFLDRLADLYPDRPLCILDVACGDGSMLRRIVRWSQKRNRAVRLSGLDLNPRAIQAAHEFPNPTGIIYINTNVFTYNPERPPDLILSAHFTHHLTDPDLVRFLRWMDQTAALGWFINDLHRHPDPYRLFRLLTGLTRWHPIIKSDGLISIRRAFTIEDWQALLTCARIPEAIAAEAFPARIIVSRLKHI